MPDWKSIRQSLLGDNTKSVLPPRVRLPALPLAVMEFSRKANEPNATPDELGRIIESDTGLTCDLLRYVNSSAFGLRKKVATAKLAIGWLGIRESRMFLLTKGVARCAEGRESKWMNLQKFSANNLERALFAKEIAKLLRTDYDLAFAASMLQDFLLPMLSNDLFPSYYPFDEQQESAPTTLAQFEQSVFGWDHAAAAAQVMCGWGFPDDLICCVLLHHRGMNILSDRKLRSTAAAAVAIASYMPDTANQVPGGMAQLMQLDEKWAAFDLLAIAERVKEEFQSIGVGFSDYDTFAYHCRRAFASAQCAG